MAVIAPGERRAVNIFLTHRDIARFMPDVSLNEVDDPENYCVAFYYKNMEDVVRCTTPRPLADFKIPHN